MSDFYHFHQDLGGVHGVKSDNVVRFLGIQYATLSNRLSEPLLRTVYADGIDARHYGPASPSPPEAFYRETHDLIQHDLPESPHNVSDLDCLNLNITTPITAILRHRRKLPVFVWIHGGGFVVGANSWPQYDPARMIQLCANNDIPVIGVSINFRLGLPGLLTSQELRDQGYKENNTLRDQRTALLWIQRFIEGFGGDPHQVTVLGGSTGAASCFLHLYSDVPLFNRIIATGGSGLLLRPAPPSYHEFAYEEILKALQLERKTTEERLQGLLTIPLTDIIRLVPSHVAYLPMQGEMLPIAPSFEAYENYKDKTIPGKDWCKELLMGDCQFDSSSMAVLMPHLKTSVGERFLQIIKDSLSEFGSLADELLEAYGFDGSPVGDDDGFVQWMDFITDIAYYAPLITCVGGWPGKAYAFHFNEQNPWEGRFKGKAAHVLDVAFLFQNFNDSLPKAQKAAAENMCLDLMKFVSGQAPWNEFTSALPFTKVYGPSSWDQNVSEPTSKVVKTMDEKARGRRNIMLSYRDSIGLDNIARALSVFMQS